MVCSLRGLLLWLCNQTVDNIVIHNVASSESGVIIAEILSIEDKPYKFGLG